MTAVFSSLVMYYSYPICYIYSLYFQEWLADLFCTNPAYKASSKVSYYETFEDCFVSRVSAKKVR